MNSLQMTCDKCRVASTCPARGSSPVVGANGRPKAFCRILGGYGRDPVDPAILSEDSRRRSEADGPCLTLAEVPDQTGNYSIVKVFSPPVRHDRESTSELLDRLVPRGGGTG